MKMVWISRHGKRLLPRRPVGKRRAAALLLAVGLTAGLLPATAFAGGGAEAACPNHPAHDETCGYQEELQVVSPCSHVHNRTCGYVESAPEIPCDRDCMGVGEDGAIVHEAGCSYRPAVEGQPCGHTHDGTCGYREETRVVSLCAHTCPLCRDGGEDEPEPTVSAAPTGEVPAAAPLGAEAIRDPKDRTDLLKSQTGFELTVKQGNTTIPEDGDLDFTQPIQVRIALKIPVMGDSMDVNGTFNGDPDSIIIKGDTATFNLAKGLSLVGGVTGELKFGAIKVGSFTLEEEAPAGESDPTLVANITFDGEDEVFNGDDHAVLCLLDATLKYDGAGKGDEEQRITVSILDKTFTIVIPASTMAYSITKKGSPSADKSQILWTVTMKAQKDGQDFDLAGYSFSDELKDVGAFVEDSFQVNGTAAAPTWNGTILSHLFPQGSTGAQTITFSTKVEGNLFANASSRQINNTAQLLKGAEVKQSATAQVNIAPTWITKTGAVVSDQVDDGTGLFKDRTIKWTITANHDGYTLPDVVITDVLQKGLTLETATYAFPEGSGWSSDVSIPDETSRMNGHSDIYLTKTQNAAANTETVKIHFKQLTSKVQLTLTTKVPNPEKDTPVTGVTKYSNSATIQWGSFQGVQSGAPNVGIGYNSIVKSSAGWDSTKGQVKWNVTVDGHGQSTIHGIKVYEILVYGGSGITADVTGFPTEDHIPAFTDIPQSFHQKYVENSFQMGADTTGLACTVTTLTKDDAAVADLVCITGGASNGDIKNDKPYSYSMKTQVTDPKIFTDTDTSVTNTAAIFDANKLLAKASATQACPSEMLAKDAIPLGGNINSLAGTASNSFDYINRCVTYRLHVNGNGMDVNSARDMTGAILAETYVLTDTLPEGWEFKTLGEGETWYEIYTGTGSSTGGKVSNLTPLASDPAELLETRHTGTTATFTFSNLSRSYVILLKAGPTAETAEKFFAENHTGGVSFSNTATLMADNAKLGDGSVDVTVKNTVLDKTVKPMKDGVLNWTVDYRPTGLGTKDVWIEDTLPEGLDLRTDSQGKLLLGKDGEAYITLTGQTLKADGSYSSGEAVTLTVGTDVTYDPAARILTVRFPDPEQAYRLTYLTDVTGELGDSLSNQVKLYGKGEIPVNSAKSYQVTDSDCKATLTRGGALEITKTDDNGKMLQDAVFTVFTPDGETVVRRGTTNSRGIAVLRGLPQGDYLLAETVPPKDCVLSATTYQVEVYEKDGKIVTSVDGGLPSNPGKFTVVNHLEKHVGSLTISKKVAGASADPEKPFTFTITLTDSTGNELTEQFQYTTLTRMPQTISSGGTVELKSGQSITIQGLPAGTKYQVEEKDYSTYAEGCYVPDETRKTGTIAAEADSEESFTNTRKVGSLEVTKTVAGSDADQQKAFEFTVTFKGKDGKPLTDPFPFTANGQAKTADQGKATFSLAGGQKAVFPCLPAGATYTAEETDYSSYAGGCYVADEATKTGTIGTDNVTKASFTNTRKAGTLEVSKAVAGDAADQQKEFEFTVTFTDKDNAPLSDAFSFTINDVSGKAEDGVAAFSLSSGERAVFPNLPEGVVYSVEEQDYSGYDEGCYVADETTKTDTIKADTVSTASFINTRKVGTLEVTKAVAGDAADQQKEFEFTVTFTDKDDTLLTTPFSFTIDDVSGKAKDGVATFSLSSGEKAVFPNLPEGVVYRVEEQDYSGYADGCYVADESTRTGKIETDQVSEASFTNTRRVGTLEVSKVVTGNAADYHKAFPFTVTFKDKDGALLTTPFSFTIDDVSGKAENGVAAFSLSNGEKAVFPNLPEDVAYAVEEDAVSANGYTVTRSGEEGTIKFDQTAAVLFTNEKSWYDDDSSGGTSTPKPKPTPKPTPTPTPTPVPTPEVSPTPEVTPSPEVSPEVPSTQPPAPSVSPEPSPVPPPGVTPLPDNGIRGTITPDDPHYTIDDAGVPRGIPPVPDPDYWLDDAGVPLGYRNEEDEWVWIEDEAVPLGFLNPQGDWVDFVPQTGDDSGLLLALFGLSGAALLGLTACLVLRRRTRGGSQH